MNVTYHINNNNKNLFLFFSGWANNAAVINHLTEEKDYDVLVCSDYRNLILPEDLITRIKSYHQVVLVGWSYGVWVGAYTCQNYKIECTRSIAICGTLYPMDDLRGIPIKITLGTLKSLSETSFQKFLFRMCGTRELYQNYLNLEANSTYEVAYEELNSLVSYFRDSQKTNFSFQYSLAYIAEEDHIFPASSQRNAWSLIDTKELPISHFALNYFKSWKDFLN